MTTSNLIEQLTQIKKNQPVKAGNLIHKQAKDELLKRNWIMLYEDENVCGYVLTELGKEKLNDFEKIKA